MQEHDASDDTLLERANSGASRIAQHLSRYRSAPASATGGTHARAIDLVLGEAINALQDLSTTLSKESRS